MLNSIFQKTLRDQTTAMIWWSAGFVIISIYFAYFYPFISKNTEILKVFESLPPMIKNLIGDIDFASSPAGFFNLQPFSYFAPLMILFYSISKGVGFVAGEQEDGTLDLLLSNPVSRTGMILQKVLAISVALVVIHLFFFAGMFLGLVLFNIDLSILRLAEAILSLYLFSLSFLTISVAAGVVFLNKRIAVGVVSGFAMISFLINAYAPAVRSLEIARLFSPFYYNSGNSPVINGLDFRLISVQILICIFFLLISLLVFKKRDLVS